MEHGAAGEGLTEGEKKASLEVGAFFPFFLEIVNNLEVKAFFLLFFSGNCQKEVLLSGNIKEKQEAGPLSEVCEGDLSNKQSK